MVNPFDLKTAILAKHAQHVVLIHCSNRFVSCGGSIRPDSALDKAPLPGGRGVLQPAGGPDFNVPGSRHRAAGVAVPARRAEAEGDSLAARGTRVRLERDDLAGVVGAFPSSATDRIPAELPPAH